MGSLYDEACLSMGGSSYAIGGFGALVLGTSLFVATAQAGLPREELGELDSY